MGTSCFSPGCNVMKRMENGRRSTVYRGLYQAKGFFPSLITLPIHPILFLAFLSPYFDVDIRAMILQGIKVVEQAHGLFAPCFVNTSLKSGNVSLASNWVFSITTEHSTPLSAMSPHAAAWRDRFARSIKYRKIFFIAARVWPSPGASPGNNPYPADYSSAFRVHKNIVSSLPDRLHPDTPES